MRAGRLRHLRSPTGPRLANDRGAAPAVGQNGGVPLASDISPAGLRERGAARELGVDLTRGLALLSMFVAHTAPSPGPGDVLELSEFLTFPLFALLVGVGAELGARRATPGHHLVGTAVRASALLAVGWLLAQSGAQVVIVLAPLGLLTLLCWALVRLPAPVVAAVGVLGWAVAPWTLAATHDQRWQWMLEQDELRLWLLDLVASTYYPQALLVACAAVGILLARWLLPPQESAAGGPPRRPSHRVLAVVSSVLALACVGLGVLGRTDRVELVAYSTTAWTDTFVVLLAAAALCTCLLVARARAARVLTCLAYAGAMTLTLYTLHIGWLAYWARGLRPGEADDAWTNLALLTVGALVVAVGWRALPLPGAWRRGPLEGLLAQITRLLTSRVPAPADGGLTSAADRVPSEH